MLCVLTLSYNTQVDARPKEVTMPLLLSQTKDASKNTIITPQEMIGEVKATNELSSDLTSSSQEQNSGSQHITIHFPRSAKRNTCIKKYVYRLIYNYFFAIPICKKHEGCKEKMETVNFSNGKTLAITFDCGK